jgi:hypothetical protein
MIDFNRCRINLKRNKPFYDVAYLLVTLTATIFVIFYWYETQQMKEQMIEQTNIQMQSLKVELMPILDIELSFGNEDKAGNYTVVLHNRGKGPANVSFCRINIQPSKISQRLALTGTQLQARTFTKKVGMLKSGGSKLLTNGDDLSYECMTIEIALTDLFRSHHKWKFEGEPGRSGYRLVDWPSFEESTNLK